MSALSLKGFFLIAVLAGLLFGAVLSSAAVAGLIEPGLAVPLGIAIVPLSLMVAGLCYLVQLVREIRTLHLPAEELLSSEAVVMETPHSIVHFRTGRPSRLWEAVGGKLVLTSHRLVFLAHRWQPWCYRFALALDDVARTEASELLGGIPGGLRIITNSGTQELFTFGAVRELDADFWAAAILRTRYQLNPNCGGRGQA